VIVSTTASQEYEDGMSVLHEAPSPYGRETARRFSSTAKMRPESRSEGQKRLLALLRFCLQRRCPEV